MENKVSLTVSKDAESFVTPQADPIFNSNHAYQNTNPTFNDPRTIQHYSSNMTSNFAVDQKLNTNYWDNLKRIQVRFLFRLFYIFFE